MGQNNQESRSQRAQILLKHKLSQARAVSHLANIEGKLLVNVMLARRDSFLAPSKLAGDQQLKNYLRTTSMTHSSLFVGQVTSVAKELVEHKRRPPFLHNRKTSASSTLQGQQDDSHTTRARAQLAKPRTSRQPLPAFSTPVMPGRQGGPAKKPRTGPKNF